MKKRPKIATLKSSIKPVDLQRVKPLPPPNRQSTRALHTGSAPWRRLRRVVLAEEGYSCRLCGLISDRNEVDHEDGNAHNNDRSNLRVLCPTCHKKHGKQGLSDPSKPSTPRYTIA